MDLFSKVLFLAAACFLVGLVAGNSHAKVELYRARMRTFELQQELDSIQMEDLP